jgi:hypothetical protein
MTFPANDFTFSLASGTSLGEQIVIPSSEIDSSLNFTLSSTVFAGDNIVGIFSSGSMTVRAGDLFFDHDIELFSEVKVFEFEEDFDFEFRAFHGIDIHFVIQVGIIHFLLTHSIVQVLFVGVIQCLIG